MALERTLSIVKPDAVKANHIGAIYQQIEAAGLKIVAAKMIRLDVAQAEGFYAEHKERPFFPRLIEFMTSGPIMVQVLEGESAISHYRDLMGPTDPEKGSAGTLRAQFATNVTVNAVHGSDSPASASREIAYFFSDEEIVG